MNNLPLSKDLINIIRKYLTISKYQIKRNYKLVVYNVLCYNKYYKDYLNYEHKYVKICYCPFCDKIEEYDTRYDFTFDLLFKSNKRNTKYIFLNDYPCTFCYHVCEQKFDLLKQLLN